MRAPQPRCEVCCGEASKYRCPKCMRRYCSLPCYRSHKGSCVAVSIEKSRNENMAEIFNSQEKEDGEVSNSDSEDTEDKVPEESLKKLNDSDELKLLLANPHLRDMLVALNTSQKPEHDIEMAMREPIFVEFADQCLEIVRDKATETYFTK